MNRSFNDNLSYVWLSFLPTYPLLSLPSFFSDFIFFISISLALSLSLALALFLALSRSLAFFISRGQPIFSSRHLNERIPFLWFYSVYLCYVLPLPFANERMGWPY